MPKRDFFQVAFDIGQQAAGAVRPKPAPNPTKNPAAVALGRLGGVKGGIARSKSLTKAQKQEIGRKGAAARWGKH